MKYHLFRAHFNSFIHRPIYHRVSGLNVQHGENGRVGIGRGGLVRRDNSGGRGGISRRKEGGYILLNL